MKYFAIVIIAVLSFLLAGCSRQIESNDLQFELPDEPPVPISLSVTHLPDGIRLSWQVPDTVSGMSFAVYYSDSLDGRYISWEKTSEFYSVISSLKTGQSYFFKVSAFTADGLEGRKSSAVEARVGVMTVLINGGDKYTDARDVIISFVVPQAASMVMLSENQDLADSYWRNFAPSLSFRLSSGDGVKNVYSRIRFADGSESDSLAPVFDDIILDTEARIDSVYFLPDDVPLAAGNVVTFYLMAPEPDGEAAISFPGLASLALYYNAGLSDPGDSEYVYSRSYTIPPNLETVGAQVVGYFIDAAGNVAPNLSAGSLLNIANPPTAVTLTAVAESSSKIRLNWSASIDNDFSAYQLYRGLDDDVSNDSEPIVVIANRSTLSYNDLGLDENTTYYYRIYVYDNTGLFAASSDANAQTLVNQPPEPVVLAVRTQVVDGDSVAVLSWTGNNDVDFASFRIYRSVDTTLLMTDWMLLSIENSQAVTSFIDDSPLPGTAFYRLAVFDLQGEYSLSNWAVKE